MKISRLLIPALAFVLTALSASAQYGTQLVVNPGFESGTTGWLNGGGGSFVAGAKPNTAEALAAHGGANQAYWNVQAADNQNPNYYIYQDVDLSGFASDIDAGNVRVDATVWSQGRGSNKIQILFYKADGSLAHTYDSGVKNIATPWNIYGIEGYSMWSGVRRVQFRYYAWDVWTPNNPVGAADDFSLKLTYDASRVAPHNNRICFIGDSITQGKSDGTQWTYRYPLWKRMIDAGYAGRFDFIGSVSWSDGGTTMNYPSYNGYSMDRDNEGHWGWRIDEVNAQLSGWMNAYPYPPDIVTILLGTNDNAFGDSVALMKSEMQQTINIVRSKNSKAIILVGLPYQDFSGSLYSDMRVAFRELAKSNHTVNSPCVAVDMQEGFACNPDSGGMTVDWTHPSNVGAAVLAETWWDALSPYLQANGAPLVPTVSLSASPTGIVEDGGTSTVTATLSAAAASNVVVSLAASGTATGGGTDYTLVPSTITITAGQLTGTTTVTAVQDVISDSNETIILDIASVTNANEAGQQQVTVTILPASTELAAPAITSITAAGTTVNLSWTSVVGATGYRVSRGTSPGNYTQSLNLAGTSTAVTGLIQGQAYYFVVVALNASGESAPSAEASITVPSAVQAGQLAKWEFAGATGNEATSPPSGSHSQLTVTALARGPGLKLSGYGLSYTSDSFAYQQLSFPGSTAAADAMTRGDYTQFTVTPQAGSVASISSLLYTPYWQNGGPALANLAIAYSIDGGAFALASVSGSPGAGNGSPLTASLSGIPALQNLTGTVTFRLLHPAIGEYNFAGIGRYTGDDIVLSGSVNSSVPTTVPPVISPNGGNFTGTQSVTLTTTTPGATIRYTTNGSTPSSTVGTVYAGAITLNSTTTLKAIAYAAGLADSSVSTATFTLTLPAAASPSFTPAAGNYAVTQNVTISSTTVGASIRYTTDGSTPTSTVGTVYTAPVSVAVSQTLKTIAYAAGMADSPVATASYTIGSAPTVAYASQSSAYTVSSTDLINGVTPTVVGNTNWAQESHMGAPALNNGVFAGRATVGTTGGRDIIWNFATPQDLASIHLFFSWVDSGRDNVPVVQIYTSSTPYVLTNGPSGQAPESLQGVAAGIAANGGFNLLATTVQTTPANGLNSKVTISSLSGTVATAVRSIYFKFGAAENDYVGCNEIDVNGFVPLPTDLANFRSAIGLAADGSQDLLTPASDGVENLLKYAFNMIGSGAGQGTTLATPNSAVLAPAGFAGLPFVAVDGSGKLALTFIRRKASSNSGITYAVQFAGDLAASDPWAVNTSATESAVSIDATFERVTVTDSASPTSRFARVKVTAP